MFYFLRLVFSNEYPKSPHRIRFLSLKWFFPSYISAHLPFPTFIDLLIKPGHLSYLITMSWISPISLLCCHLTHSPVSDILADILVRLREQVVSSGSLTGYFWTSRLCSLYRLIATPPPNPVHVFIFLSGN